MFANPGDVQEREQPREEETRVIRLVEPDLSQEHIEMEVDQDKDDEEAEERDGAKGRGEGRGRGRFRDD